jgi:hypothetical protein
MGLFEKSPDGDLDYPIDWAAWLNGDTIATSTWVAETGITIGTGAHAPSIDGDTTIVWLSGGTLNESYAITNKIVTNNSPPRTTSKTIHVAVVNRRET